MAAIRNQGAGAAKPTAEAKKTPAAAPKGTSSILDAIRGGGGPGAAAAPAKAAAAKPAQPKSVDPKAAGGLSAAEMIRAARTGKGTGAAPDDSDKPAVALPKKPLAAKAPKLPAKKDTTETRRGFIGRTVSAICTPVVIAWTSFIVMSSTSLLALARFMMPNVLVEPPTQFKVGPPSDYAPGTVSTKWQAQFGIWVVNAEVDGKPVIYALSTICTHLGCTPNWLEGEQKFKCPCHGSGFYKSGVNFEGPAPRPLERMGIRIAEDGMLEVDKSVKFQKELGQWTNPASYVEAIA